MRPPADFESGVIAHGPQAEELAGQYLGAAAALGARLPPTRRGDLPVPAQRARAPDPLPQGAVIKRHGVVTVTWP